jgi:hypothetical protein
MRAYGSDRVAAGEEEGTYLISARLPKRWTARVPKALNRREFPGTAVLWDEELFEVIAVEPLAHGIRYTLAPWHDQHAVRASERYDDETEARRLAEWRAAHARERRRRAANLLGIFTGHLPAVVQEHLASEVGINPNRLTLLSCVPEWIALIFAVLAIVQAVMDNSAIPTLAIAGLLVGADAMFRILFVMTQARPIGSPAGMLLYGIWYAIAGGVSPFTVAKGHGVRFALPPSEEVAARDALHMREPLITLLTPAEQARAAERFGYDFRRTARTVAVLILTFAILGVITSIRSHAISALIVAGALAIEQIIRLATLRHHPAGSILAFLARPFVRRYI